MIILFNFASKRPYEWYIWLKFSPKIALFPCYVFWFVFISAAIKWGTVMIGQSRDFSCLLTNFPCRIKKKHCARRKHSKITKEGKFLFSENGGYEQVPENCFPSRVFFFFETFVMQPLLSKHILLHAVKKYPILTFLSEGWRFMWAEDKDLSLLKIKFSAKCVGEVSNWLVMFTCGENLNETGEILIKS